MTRSDATAAAIALNRFGLGVRADEPLPGDAKGWLLAQFASYEAQPAEWSAQPSSASLLVAYGDLVRAQRQADAASEVAARQKLAAEVRDRYRAAVAARVTTALVTPAPFAERLVHFWANHFAVSIEKPSIGSIAGAFEAEAIRPNVFGSFEDAAGRGRAPPGDADLPRPGPLDRTREHRRAARRRGRPRAPARPQREPRARDPRTAHDRRAQRLQPGRRHRARPRAHRLERRRRGRPVLGASRHRAGPLRVRLGAARARRAQRPRRALRGFRRSAGARHPAPASRSRRRRRGTSRPSWRATSPAMRRRRRSSIGWRTRSCAATAICRRSTAR